MKNHFRIHYRLTPAGPQSVADLARSVAYEQSVEVPDDILTDELRVKSTGKPAYDDIRELGDGSYEMSIAYPVDNIGGEVTQFLNILYGNCSLFPGVKITDVEWNELPNKLFTGPRIGIRGIRKTLGVKRRALSCTALKPIGLNTKEIAYFCLQFASGGIDIIKDDHGMANQKSAPFEERVIHCMQSIERAADKTGKRTAYFPNITAGTEVMMKRLDHAVSHGAGGVLICPHLCGLESMHHIAEKNPGIPIMAHPAFSGGYVQSANHGMTPEFLYGILWRALGADLSVYPNVGGRFSFSAGTCKSINETCRDSTLPFKTSFPVPGGGVQRNTIPDLAESYGSDTVFLVGGSLYQHPKGPNFAAREITEALARH